MYCLKKRTIAAVLIGFGVTTSALADSAAERVRQINEEIAVLSARLQKLDLEAKIVGKEVEMQRLSSSANGAGANDETPVVRAIDGMDGKLVATLAMRGGVLQTVREGEKFGAWTTKTITVNAVTLARGKETIRVPFGNEPPAATGAAGGPGGPGAPGGPMFGGGPGQPPAFGR